MQTSNDEPYEKAPDFLAAIRAEQLARRSGEQLTEMLPVYGVTRVEAEIDEKPSASVIEMADSRRRLSRSALISAPPKKPPGK